MLTDKINIEKALKSKQPIVPELGCGSGKKQGGIGIDKIDLPNVDIVADLEDGLHLKYFDTVDEYEDFLGCYLEHDDEREKIARAGMQWIHDQFNCRKIVKYLLDVVKTGTYQALWTAQL